MPQNPSGLPPVGAIATPDLPPVGAVASPSAPAQPDAFDNPQFKAMLGKMLATQMGPIGENAHVQDAVIGVLRSGLGTIEGGGKLIRSIPGIGPALESGPEVTLPVTPTPSNTTQAVGKVAGNIGQFFLPSAALGKVKTALATGSGILDALIGAGVEGTSAGAISSAQTGSVKEGAKTAALTAGTGLVMQGALKAFGPAGRTIEQRLIKPTTADFKDGFNVATVAKYDLGGNLSQTYDKTQAALDSRTQELRQLLKANPGGQVDLLDALSRAESKITSNPAKVFGQNTELGQARDKLLSEIMAVSKTGIVDPATANEVKQGVGTMGAWLYNPKGSVYGDAGKALETMANAFYAELKVAIEQGTGQPAAVRAVNQQISELIPVARAVIRRIPVEQRQAVLSLTDVLTLSSKTYGLAILNRLLKSGQAANAATKAAAGAKTIAPILGRGVGAVGSQVIGGGGWE